MSSVNWDNWRLTMTLTQSQNKVHVVMSEGSCRVMCPTAQSHNWTVWATVNGTKSNTIPISVDPDYPQICTVLAYGSTAAFDVDVPSNLIGTTVTISFFAQDGSYEQDSGSDPPPSGTIYMAAPTVNWSSGASVSATGQNENVVASLSGSASVGGGYSGTVYYRIWCDNTRKNSDGSTATSWTFAPTAFDTPVTITVQAYSTINGTTYTSSNLTTTVTVESEGYVAYYNGSGWVKCKVHYFNGTAWVDCIPHYYNGSNWVQISYTP